MVNKSLIFLALLSSLGLLPSNVNAYNAPSVSCEADGLHSNVYNRVTNSWSCVPLKAAGVPSAGLVLSTGTSFLSTVNNSTNWNTAFSWGNHASSNYLTAVTLSGDVTSTGSSSLTTTLANTATARAHIGLGNVENTALSTWAGSTNLTTLGSATVNSLTVSNITGSTQCLRVNSSGVVSGVGADCGSSSAIPIWANRYQPGMVYPLSTFLYTMPSTVDTNIAICGIFEVSDVPWEVSSMQVSVELAGDTSNAQMAIYGPIGSRYLSATDVPLLAATSTFETVSTGTKTGLFATDVTLNVGAYLSCLNSDGGSPRFRTLSILLNDNAAFSGGTDISSLYMDETNTANFIQSVTFAMHYNPTGVWPSTTGALTRSTIPLPFIGLKTATP